MRGVGRWVPDAQGRLIAAAVDLFEERGFEEATVAEIAERAGLTERTFFRYFADKREVLFFGSAHLENAMVEALEKAPADLSALDAVGAAIEDIAPFFDNRRPHAQRRRTIINANPELQEREHQKIASLVVALARGLKQRGVKELRAGLVAEMGVTIFKIAFERWLYDPKGRTYAQHVREALREIKAISAA